MCLDGNILIIVCHLPGLSAGSSRGVLLTLWRSGGPNSTEVTRPQPLGVESVDLDVVRSSRTGVGVIFDKSPVSREVLSFNLRS